MELLYDVVTIIQAMAIGLGVGVSTMTIVHFFVAIADDEINASERTMLGAEYIVLRVAMLLILSMSALQALVVYLEIGRLPFTPLAIVAWTAIATLFFNAYLMTARLIPSRFGPAIQAGSWYTLGLISSFITVQWVSFSTLTLFLIYVSIVALFIIVVNGVMKLQAQKRQSTS